MLSFYSFLNFEDCVMALQEVVKNRKAVIIYKH